MRKAILTLGFGLLIAGCGGGSTSVDSTGVMHDGEFYCLTNCCTNQNRVVPCPPKDVAFHLTGIMTPISDEESEARFNAVMEKELEVERAKISATQSR